MPKNKSAVKVRRKKVAQPPKQSDIPQLKDLSTLLSTTTLPNLSKNKTVTKDDNNFTFIPTDIPPLLLSARDNDVAGINQAIAEGADINLATDDGLNALHVACQEGSLDAVRALLGHGINVNAKGRINDTNATALHFACAARHIKTDPDAKANYEAIAITLIDHGVDVNEITRQLESAFHLTLKHGLGTVALRLLEIENLDVTFRFKGKKTLFSPLFLLLDLPFYSEQADILISLIEKDLDPTTTSETLGGTLMHKVAEHNNTPCAKILFDKGVIPTKHNKEAITPLHIASQRGHVEMVQWLLDHNADPNAMSAKLDTPITLACHPPGDDIQDRCDAVAVMLLEKLQALSIPVIDPNKALFFALYRGMPKAIGKLMSLIGIDYTFRINGLSMLQMAASPKHYPQQIQVIEKIKQGGNSIHEAVGNDNKDTLLHIVAENGNTPCVAFFVQQGLDINIRNRVGITPLMHASRKGHTKTVEFLLKNRAKPDLKAKDGTTALFHAAHFGWSDIVNLLLAQNAGPNVALCHDHATALHAACLHEKKSERARHDDCALALLEAGAEPDARKLDDTSPLHYACGTSSAVVVSKLIDTGVDVNVKFLDSSTTIMLSISNPNKSDRPAIIQALVDAGAELNTLSSGGTGALHRAIQAKDTASAITLIKLGTNPNLPAKTGETPLHFCARHDMVDVAKYLIERGAKLSAGSKATGKTPLHVAAQFGSIGIIELFITGHAGKKLDVNITPSSDINTTALDIAVFQNTLPSVVTLITFGAMSNLISDSGNTALHMAAQRSSTAICRELLDHGWRADIQNDLGNTPIHLAAITAHLDSLKAMLEKFPEAALIKNSNEQYPIEVCSTPNTMAVLFPCMTQEQIQALAEKAIRTNNPNLLKQLVALEDYVQDLPPQPNKADAKKLLSIAIAERQKVCAEYLIETGTSLHETIEKAQSGEPNDLRWAISELKQSLYKLVLANLANISTTSEAFIDAGDYTAEEAAEMCVTIAASEINNPQRKISLISRCMLLNNISIEDVVTTSIARNLTGIGIITRYFKIDTQGIEDRLKNREENAMASFYLAIKTAKLARAMKLFTAIEKGNMNEASDLIELGVDNEQRNSSNETHFHAACRKQQFNIAAELIEDQALIEKINTEQESALVVAIKHKAPVTLISTLADKQPEYANLALEEAVTQQHSVAYSILCSKATNLTEILVARAQHIGDLTLRELIGLDVNTKPALEKALAEKNSQATQELIAAGASQHVTEIYVNALETDDDFAVTQLQPHTTTQACLIRAVDKKQKNAIAKLARQHNVLASNMLIEAAQSGDAKTMSALKTHIKDSDRALLDAVENDQIVQYRLTIQQVEKMATSSTGNTPLHLAILKNDTHATKTLARDKNTNVDAKNSAGQSTVDLAIASQNEALIEAVAARSANRADYLSNANLSQDCRHIFIRLSDPKEIMQAIQTLESIAPELASNMIRFLPAQDQKKLAEQTKSPETLKTTFAGYNKKQLVAEYLKAIEEDDTQRAELLVEQVDIELALKTALRQRKPKAVSICSQNPKAVEAVLQQIDKVELVIFLRDHGSENASELAAHKLNARFLAAASQADGKTLFELLDLGVNPGIVDDKQRNAAHLVAASGNPDLSLLQQLHQRGAQVFELDCEQNTAVNILIQRGKVDIARNLIQSLGIKLHITALIIARTGNSERLRELTAIDPNILKDTLIFAATTHRQVQPEKSIPALIKAGVNIFHAMQSIPPNSIHALAQPHMIRAIQAAAALAQQQSQHQGHKAPEIHPPVYQTAGNGNNQQPDQNRRQRKKGQQQQTQPSAK